MIVFQVLFTSLTLDIMTDLSPEALLKGGRPTDSWNGAKGKTPKPQQVTPPKPEEGGGSEKTTGQE